MSQAQYDVYVSNVLSLAKSMVIKCQLQAQAINTYLTKVYNVTGNPAYLVNTADPTTWKYYMNLSGQYHPSDTPMQVISQDSLQTIDFTIANLQINTATATAYAVGSKYYNDLVAAYPGQSQLIRGILNPVDKTAAINADDGKVLWMDPSLVESNEMNLASEITQWVQYWFRRWNTPAYANVDELYVSAMLGVMYVLLPHTILRIRLKNAATYQAHSYHLIEFLASNGMLDQYAAALTKPQMLYLRRNIRYILRNPGKKSTFQMLVDNIMTARDLPLSDWTMRHDLTNTQATLAPNPLFVRGEVNTVISEGGIATRDVAGMLEVEVPLARDNADDADTVTEVTNTLAWSLDDNLSTKVLESSVLDTTDATPYKLSDCLLNHWIYFAAKGIYTANIAVQDPRTGDNYNFTPSDAFVVYMYAFAAGQGLPITEIPLVYANKVRKIPTPTPAEIRPYLTDAVDDNALMAVFANQPTIARQYISIDAFNAEVNAIHLGENYQHALFSTQGHLWTRAELEFATLYLWTDDACDFGQGQDYATWFASRNLDIPSLTQDQLTTLANNLVQTATGVNNSTVLTLAQIQAAMIGIMRRLSSYSVQYIASINTSPIIVMERPSIRLGDVVAEGSDSTYVTIPQGRLVSLDVEATSDWEGLVVPDITRYNQSASGEATHRTSVTVRVAPTVRNVVTQRVPQIAARLMSVTDNLNWDQPQGLDTDLGQYQMAAYQSLPEAFTGLTLPYYPTLGADDQATMQSRYTTYIAANGTPTGLLSFYIQTTQLPDLYPTPSP